MRHDVVDDDTLGDAPRPFHHGRDTEAALPVGVFLATKGRYGGIRPGVVMRTIIGGVHNNRIVGHPERVEMIQ